MRTKVLVLGLVCLFLTSLFADEKDIVSLFESIVNKFDEFMSTSPVVLISEDIGKFSPSGRINYLLKFEKLDLVYNIQKTNSLVSPYTGYIVVSLRVQSNEEYGDITKTRRESGKIVEEKDKSGKIRRRYEEGKEVEYSWGFQYAEDAEKVKKFSKCVDDPEYSEIEWCCGDVKLLYAYQGGKWVFKEVITGGSNRIGRGAVRGDIEKIILENPEWQEAILQIDKK